MWEYYNIPFWKVSHILDNLKRRVIFYCGMGVVVIICWMYMASWEGERIEGLNKDLRRMNLFASSAYFGLLSRWQSDKVKYKTYGAWCFILVVVCVLFTLSLVFLWIKGVQLVFLAGFEGDSPNRPCWFFQKYLPEPYHRKHQIPSVY